MKYEIIYADPPWEFGSTTKLGNARNYYPTLTFKQLEKLKIPSDNNCLLFMWVVSNQIDKIIQLAVKWGFTYNGVAFVWHKPNRTLCGYYTMAQTELCLIFKKGKIPQPRGARNVFQFLSEKATIHSKKPDEIRERILKMFPTQKKIELFARKKVDGWDVFGNEINKNI
jgi:N6-adenosine-specific RNA methylase IME4